MNQRIRHRSFLGFVLLINASARPSEVESEVLSSTNLHRGKASSAELFAHWTAEKISNATPLDLKIDPLSGEGFVVGEEGLVSYADMFAAGTQQVLSAAAEDGAVEASGAPVVRLDSIYDEQTLSRKFKLKTKHAMKKKLRGAHTRHHERALAASNGCKLDLASIKFKSRTSLIQHDERKLAHAGGFVSQKRKGPSKKDKTNRKKRKEDGNDIEEKIQGSTNKKKFLPKIQELQPSRGTEIPSAQTFSARITPSSATLSNIKDVSLRLVDPEGESSDWLSVPQTSEDFYEITIEGFGVYPTSKWKYQMMAQDDDGRTVESTKVMFKVDGNAGEDPVTYYDDFTDEAPTEPDQDSKSADNMLSFDVVEDSNWPYGGGIQSATGRILFEFDGGTGTYVCSGTVVQDGNVQGRSVILTAAHCAYNDSLKKFASKAIFIPDQVSTRGSKSDFNCANDKYGCWVLSFAVVSNGWATTSFPENVEFDYAFYTVLDGSHSNGYSGRMSGTLDVDTVPMRIDFGSDPEKDFGVALGYSANKDPAFRYCTNDISSIKGVPWYKNLWIDRCGMTGGASGGPWVVKMDTNGVGTVVSVNSWGFTDKVGMAGPQLRTSSGSLAECLFEKAKSSGDPGSVGGYIVKC